MAVRGGYTSAFLLGYPSKFHFHFHTVMSVYILTHFYLRVVYILKVVERCPGRREVHVLEM